MKHVLLATAMALASVSAITVTSATTAFANTAQSSLGDLASYKTIVSDVQGLVAKSDMTAAAARITDFETAWDHDAKALRGKNAADWFNIDDATDTALDAVRAKGATPAGAKTALASLMAVLDDPSKPAK